jgi:dGTPase
MIHKNVRERLEREEERLSPYAAKSRLSRGRDVPEEPSPVRTEFQRDRDRIIHSKAFRRLKHKTQVFIAPAGDHYVTRLTHTLEVAQIARTIARALKLNEDLTEAIALGHDLGHTPFGHVGEEVLNELFPEGFHHNEQSLRVVEVLEKEGRGLNLTWEVRDGILNHSKPRDDLMGSKGKRCSTLEGEVCRISDSIAYINHDIGDAIRAGMIGEDDLPAVATARLGKSSSERINTLVCDIIDCSCAVSGEVAPGQIPPEELTIAMSPSILKAAEALRDFLFKEVYEQCSHNEEAQRAREIVRFLYYYFISKPQALPTEFRMRGESLGRAVVD